MERVTGAAKGEGLCLQKKNSQELEQTTQTQGWSARKSHLRHLQEKGRGKKNAVVYRVVTFRSMMGHTHEEDH